MADIVTWAQANMALLAVIVIIAGGIALFIKGVGRKVKMGSGIVALFCVALLVLGFIGPVPTGGGGGGGDSGVEFVVQTTNTYPAAADAATEFLDTQSFTACDGGTPDYNGAIATWATNAFSNNADGTFLYQSDMDQDLARTATAFQEIDCLAAAVTVNLAQGIDANGDGTLDAINWGFKLLSAGPATFVDGNATAQSTVAYDSDAGWEIAYYTSGAEWVSAFAAGDRFSLSMPSSGPWVMVDTHAGGGAAADTGVLAILLNTVAGSPAGYTVPSQVGVVLFSAQFAVGNPDSYRVITLNWLLQSRA